MCFSKQNTNKKGVTLLYYIHCKVNFFWCMNTEQGHLLKHTHWAVCFLGCKSFNLKGEILSWENVPWRITGVRNSSYSEVLDIGAVIYIYFFKLNMLKNIFYQRKISAWIRMGVSISFPSRWIFLRCRVCAVNCLEGSNIL